MEPVIKRPLKSPEARAERRLLWRETEEYVQREPGRKTVKLTTKERERRRIINKGCWKEAQAYARKEGELARLVGRPHDYSKLLHEKFDELREERDVQTENERLREYALSIGIPIGSPKIEIPSRYSRPHPARTLEVGDSYFVPGSPSRTRSMAGSVHGIGKITSRTFTTRRCVEDGVPGMRVWRLT
jgi:hypothetical protein